MRKSIVVVLLLFVAAQLFADPPNEDVLRPRLGGRIGLFLELDAGLNFNLLDGNPYLRPLMSYEQQTTLYKSALGVSPIIGVMVGYDLSSHFSIGLRADYDPRFTAASASLIDSSVLRDPFNGAQQSVPMTVNKKFNVDATYLSISLIPSYRFENLVIYAGPTFGIPISRSVSETDQITGDNPYYYLSQGADSSKIITGSLTDINNLNKRLGLRFGLRYMVALTPSIDLVPQVGLAISLNDLFTNQEDLKLGNPSKPASSTIDIPINSHSRINTLQASVGVRFHF